MDAFRQTIEVRWADCDANQHVRHSAYADFCAHTRIEWLRSHGFGFDRFQELGLGPVLFTESTEYFKELRMSERLVVELRLAGMSADAGRFALRHDLFKEDGRPAARHEVRGAWLDVRQRHLVQPPPDLAAILGNLARTDDFAEIVRNDR